MLFQSPSVADTVEGLLMGRGHHFSFDRDFWSDSGVSPTPGTIGNITVSQSSGGQRFGTGVAEVTADLSFDVGFPTNKWTVIFWRFISGEWQQIVQTTSNPGRVYANGVDAGIGTVGSVSDGVMTVTFGVYNLSVDDLVILPFAVDESFITALYAWQTDNGVVMQCPFDYPGDFVDRVHGNVGVPTVPANIAAGDPTRKTGSGSLLNTDPLSNVDFPVSTGDPVELDTDDEITICFWLNPESDGTSGSLADQFDSSGPLFGWRISMVAGALRVFYRLNSLGDSPLVLDPNTVSAGEWVHVTMVYSSPATPTLSLYKNGALVGTDTGVQYSDQSAVNVFIGDKDATDSVECNIDDFRYYKSALTTAQIADIYNQGSYGYDYIPPQGRAFSKLPRLLVSGDCIGSQHPKQVIGKVNSEPYVQHGGPFSPNDRSMEMFLQEVSPLREEGIPRPDAHFLLEPEFITDNVSAPIQRADASGAYVYEDGSVPATAPTQVYDSDDSFGFCLDFDGVVSTPNSIFLPSSITSGSSNFAVDLGGKTGVTVAAWVNVDSLTDNRYILSSPASTTDDKLLLRVISTSGNIQFGVRTTVGGSTESIVTAGPVIVVGNWYFIVGVADLKNGTLAVYGNLGGAGPEPVLSLIGDQDIPPGGQDYFSSETSTTTARITCIGTQSDRVTDPFDGKIKSVMVWKRALEMDEIMTTFRKGYDRRIFR